MTNANILDDVSRLEDLLGHPWDSSNPLGFAALVGNDELGQLSPAGEAALDRFCLNAEFVPVAHGGRFVNLERLIAVMRGIFRRDPCLGLGYGASSLLAALNVWVTGSAEQQQRVATYLLANRKLACGYHELAHGNDIGQASCSAAADGDAFVLHGLKQVVANISRADTILVYARTSDAAGPRSHSLFLIDRAAAPLGTVRDLPRYATSGMRGIPLGGVEFDGYRVDVANRVGALGRGMETALKAFQLSRIALPGMFAGIVDTGLRITFGHVRRRKLYGSAVSDLPLVRTQLAETFADLLLCDAFCTVAASAARLLPGELSLYAAALKALVPGLLIDSMNRLASIAGAHSYLREGDMAVFQKLLRDVQPVGFGHASRTNCLMSLLPQLPVLARRSWQKDASVPTALFALDNDTGEMSFEDLAITAGGRDSLAPTLRRFALDGAQEPEVAAWARRLAIDFDDLAARCAELNPASLTPDATPETFVLAERYAVLLAAAACIGVWRAQWDRGDSFLSRPVWLLAALQRVGVLLGDRPMPLAEPLCEAMFAELAQRCDNNLSLDLRALQLGSQSYSNYHDGRTPC